MKKYFFITVIACISLSACNQLIKKKESKTETVENSSEEDEESTAKPKKKKGAAETNSAAQILNHISVHEEGGLKIARAFLANESGELVSSRNTVKVGEPVYLNLLIEKGWVEENGTVSLGAAEKIETDDGELVLNAPDLFKDKPTLEESKANSIQIKARITQTTPSINYFIIHYRVWDKQGYGKVSGSYKLYIDEGKE